MKIRSVQHSDSSQVAELVRGLSHYYLEHGVDELPDWLKSTLTDSAFAERISDSSYHNFVAEIDGEIVGYISLKGSIHLYHLFVLPKFHKQGIAKSLWRHCIETMDIENCSVRSSIYAVPVYTKFGFIASGETGYKDGIGFQPMVYSGTRS